VRRSGKIERRCGLLLLLWFVFAKRGEGLRPVGWGRRRQGYGVEEKNSSRGRARDSGLVSLARQKREGRRWFRWCLVEGVSGWSPGESGRKRMIS
jgi:hypothetical protein